MNGVIERKEANKNFIVSSHDKIIQGAHEKGTEKNFSMNNTEYPTEQWKSI